MTSSTIAPREHDGTQVVRRSREQVGPRLRAAVDHLPATMRRIAGYHLGWWDEHDIPTPGGEGKAVRPALLLATARALGGTCEGALSGAAAVELVHNFTLLHDDVMDGDILRRHRPTAWSLFGTTDAILAGDALQALAWKLLAEDGHPASGAVARQMANCMIELCEGQSADCAFEERTDVNLTQCLDIAMAKTGALLGAACASGALYAGASPQQVAAMDRFGRHLGLAFQIIDDILGIWGDPTVTGKTQGADLAARKMTLPVVAALSSPTTAGQELRDLYPGNGQFFGPVQIEHVADLVDRAGARQWAREQATAHTSTALAHLDSAVTGHRPADDLRALTDLLLHRDR